MTTMAELYPDQVCPACDYAYGPESPGECSNPICLANPSLSDASRQRIADRSEAHRAETAARAERMRLYGQSLSRRH